jgi:16S rRNA (cytosine967-C5)-methyltransferase
MTTHSPGTASRLAAAHVLDAVLHRGRSLKSEFANALPKLADPRDRALVEAICFAALRQRARYAAALDGWMAKPLGQRDAALRALLYVGFAQIDALRLPAHAAVDATVEAARALGRTHQAGMVNALLRRALREGLPQADPAQAWPGWLLAEVRRDWPAQADALLAASATAAPLWLRTNRLRISREDYRLRLQAAGVEANAHPALTDALWIADSMAVVDLPGFEDGLVSVQDGSAQAVADVIMPGVIAPAPGARVLDACAAPGGKAAHLLERDPSLRLTALEVDPRRLRRTAETLKRVGVDATVELKTVDATHLAAWWDGTPFDAVLIDAPCSATGIVRRQPDILLHRKPTDIDALVSTQAWLLDALWPVVAPGGALVYATCSILARENAGQIDAFLARTPDAVAEPLDDRFGHVAGAGRQRLPGEDGMDGFFYARLRKV